MFVKAIRFKDVKPGDVVCEKIGSTPVTIREITVGRDDVVLWPKNGNITLPGHPDAIIGLVHRPRPEGMTEVDMLERIQSALRETIQRVEHEPFRAEDALRAVREVLEAWELDKSLEK